MMRKITLFIAFLSLMISPAVSFIRAEEAEKTEPAVVTQPRQTFRGFRSERAVIHWQGGIQQMVISPRLSREGNTPWLLPIKARPEEIQYRLTENLPYGGGGIDCRQIARRNLDNFTLAMISTQLWTIPILYNSIDRASQSLVVDSRRETNLEGVHIELLAADSVASLADQLQALACVVDPTALEAYSACCTPDHSLLAVWMDPPPPLPAVQDETAGTDANRPRRAFWRRPGVFVEFPTPAPFYPMSHRGLQPGRISLTLTGFWQPDSLSSAAVCSQRIVRSPQLCPEFETASIRKNVALTTLEFGRSEEAVQSDLTFKPGQPTDLEYADKLTSLSFPTMATGGVLLLAIVSYLSSGISGLLTFRRWRGFAAFGLWNVFTLAALGIAMKFSRSGAGSLLREHTWKARLYFCVFSILTILLIVAAVWVIKLPLR